MSKTAYVYSTATTAVEYVKYGPAVDGQPAPKLFGVIIKGGSNVTNKHGETRVGVMTEVTREQADFLSTDVNFKRHEKAGFVVLTDHKIDPEVVAAGGMKLADKSAQLVPGDARLDGGAKLAKEKTTEAA